jgi:Cleaved Adhesin Domain/Secretion system C-terminal sorting domain
MKTRYFQLIIFIILFFSISAYAQKWEESFTNSSLPQGWQVIDNDGSGKGLELVSSVVPEGGPTVLPQSGAYFISSNFANANLANTIDEWIISPQISVIYSGDSLFFWAGAKDGAFKDSLRVLVSTTGNSISDFKYLLGYFKVDGPTGSWHKYGFDLSAFDSSDIYLALNYYIKDGGSGGRNSDHLWIDHFIVSGKPSDRNQPPLSFNLTGPQNYKWLHPVADTTIHFKWRSSYNADNDPLTYKLTIMDVFPAITAEVVNDTTFDFNWADVIEYYSAFRWTVNVTDGKSTIACPDTFLFITPPKENLAPYNFSLIFPEQQQIISLSDSTQFSWQPSFDPNLDDLFYKLQISGNDLDTLFTGIIDTSVSISCGDFLAENSTYSWTVFADDSLLETQSMETWQIKTSTATSVNDALSEVPIKMQLMQNYPNPFNPETIITFNLASSEFIELSVYNISGQKIATLINDYMQAGQYKSVFNAAAYQLSSGVYIYQLKSINSIEKRKLLFIK